MQIALTVQSHQKKRKCVKNEDWKDMCPHSIKIYFENMAFQVFIHICKHFYVFQIFHSWHVLFF